MVGGPRRQGTAAAAVAVGASLVLIVGSLAVPVAVLGGFVSGSTTGEPGTGSMLVALAFYVVTYFITLFFNTALVVRP